MKTKQTQHNEQLITAVMSLIYHLKSNILQGENKKCKSITQVTTRVWILIPSEHIVSYELFKQTNYYSREICDHDQEVFLTESATVCVWNSYFLLTSYCVRK